MTEKTHTFLVRAHDASGQHGAASRYTWRVANAPPLVGDIAVTLQRNTTVTIILGATDPDAVRFELVSLPQHGALIGLRPYLVYQPDTDFLGMDSFQYRVNDGESISDVATVTITVNDEDPFPPGCAYLRNAADVTAQGEHTLYVARRAIQGGGEAFENRIFKIDTTPPTLTCSVTPNVIWPANGEFVTVNATVNLSAAVSGPASFTLVAVTSSDPSRAENVQGWTIGTPDVVGQVRAAPPGRGIRQVYTLTYRGEDVAGNAALCSAQVTVTR